jgi:HAD superfamily hydrolase (TIGR01662 family)
MIRAAYFDWSNTLVGYNPPREESYRKAFQDVGFNFPIKPICKGLAAGDEYFLSHNSRYLKRGVKFDEQIELFICYAEKILSEAGTSASYELQMEVMQKVLKEYTGVLVPYEDVLPLFRNLKERRVTIGVITNADRRVEAVAEKLGLKPFLDVMMTSEEAGVEKPDARIFEAALAKIQIKSSEAIYVGDQYRTDILGALSVGMVPILIDRLDINQEIKDCTRIRSLSEVLNYL